MIMKDICSAGEPHTVLTQNLLVMYDTSHSPEFKSCIQSEFQNKFDSGITVVVETMMLSAQRKYIALRDNGKWVIVNAGKEQMVALVAALRAASIKPNKTSSSPSSNAPAKVGSNDRLLKAEYQASLPQWKLVPPVPNDPRT